MSCSETRGLHARIVARGEIWPSTDFLIVFRFDSVHHANQDCSMSAISGSKPLLSSRLKYCIKAQKADLRNRISETDKVYIPNESAAGEKQGKA